MSATAIACPDWCTRTDHHADVVSAEEPAIHYGPEFRGVYVQGDGQSVEAVVVLANSAASVSDPAELREVAADMVRAAEWLEARA